MTRDRAGKDDRKEAPVATMEPSEQIKQLVKREGNRGSEMKGIWNRVPKVSWSLFCCQGSRRHISDIKKEHKSWHETLLLKQYLPSQCSLRDKCQTFWYVHFAYRSYTTPTKHWHSKESIYGTKHQSKNIILKWLHETWTRNRSRAESASARITTLTIWVSFLFNYREAQTFINIL